MNILFIGLVGSGKSTIGSLLAKELAASFVETDVLTLERTGYESVKAVYDDRVSLWEETEIEVMKQLSHKDNQVIACGGGIAENDINFQFFRENSKVTHIIYLRSEASVLAERVLTTHADMTMNEIDAVTENMKQLFEKRDTLYRLQATMTIDTTNKTATDNIKEILAAVKQ
jgi:shikimate kinase